MSPDILKHPETHERAASSSAKDFLAATDAVLSPVLVLLSVPSHCCMQPHGASVSPLSLLHAAPWCFCQSPLTAACNPMVLLSVPSHCCMQPQGTVIVILSSATCKTLDFELFLKELSAHQDNLNAFKTSILLFPLKIDFFFF